MNKYTNVFKMFFAALATVVCLSPIFFTQNYLVKAANMYGFEAYTGPDYFEDDIHQEVMAPAKYYQLTANWANPATPYNLNGKNDIKFHWYKKAQIKAAWNNVGTEYDRSLIGSVQNNGGHIDLYGKDPIIGYVDVNGDRYYIRGDDSIADKYADYHQGYELLSKAAFEQPKLMKVTSTIKTYIIGAPNTRFDGSGQDAFSVQAGTKISKNSTILIPSHHDPVDLFGTKYVPVISTDQFGVTGADLIKYSDYQKYLASGEGRTMQYGSINKVTQKNGHVISNDNGFTNKAIKYINRQLKKNIPSFEKCIKRDFKGMAGNRYTEIPYKK